MANVAETAAGRTGCVRGLSGRLENVGAIAALPGERLSREKLEAAGALSRPRQGGQPRGLEPLPVSHQTLVGTARPARRAALHRTLVPRSTDDIVAVHLLNP